MITQKQPFQKKKGLLFRPGSWNVWSHRHMIPFADQKFNGQRELLGWYFLKHIYSIPSKRVKM